MMTKEGSIKIVNIVTPGSGVLVLRVAMYRVVQKVFIKMASRSDERDVNISQKLSHNA